MGSSEGSDAASLTVCGKLFTGSDCIIELPLASHAARDCVTALFVFATFNNPPGDADVLDLLFAGDITAVTVGCVARDEDVAVETDATAAAGAV